MGSSYDEGIPNLFATGTSGFIWEILGLEGFSGGTPSLIGQEDALEIHYSKEKFFFYGKGSKPILIEPFSNILFSKESRGNMVIMVSRHSSKQTTCLVEEAHVIQESFSRDGLCRLSKIRELGPN